MRIGYGLNRTEKDFAGQNCDRLFLDTAMSNREQFAELFHGALRLDPGDVIVVYHERDLGRGRGLAQVRKMISDKGLTIEAFGPSNGTKKANEGTRGIPYEQAVEAQKYWHAAGIGPDFINAHLAREGKKRGEVWGPYARHQYIYALGNKADKPRTLTPPGEPIEEESE